MSPRTARVLTALSGLVGSALLAVYFLAAPPLPPANATVAQVVSVATHYHDRWLLGAWIQATATLLSVIFFLALVHLAGWSVRFTGLLTLLGSAVLLTVTLIEGVFTIDLAQAAANGHAETSLSSYDLMSVFVHIYPLAPAPLIYVALGLTLIGSRLLPPAFGYTALALGIFFEIAGIVGLLFVPILTLVALGCQALWVIVTAVALLLGIGATPARSAPAKASIPTSEQR